jgi:lipid II isoglutaminyl synthase (glutamine-hydrolysing)
MTGARESAARIVVLAPELLGTYGDWGNALVLAKRLEWRGVASEIVAVRDGAAIPDSGDLYLLGGGEDGPQLLACDEIRRDGGLHRAAERGAVVFGACAGLQLMGTEFHGPDGPVPGLGLLDCRTAPGSPRAIGEVLTQSHASLGVGLLTGFENHGGRTSLGPDAAPVGTVVHGVGNSEETRTEGAWSGKVLGTYLHGPVLARNPRLADLLLTWAVGALPPLEVPEAEVLHDERVGTALAASQRRLGPIATLLRR